MSVDSDAAPVPYSARTLGRALLYIPTTELRMAGIGDHSPLRWRDKRISASNSNVPASPGVYVIGHNRSLHQLELNRVYVYAGETMNLQRRLDEHLPETEGNPGLRAWLRRNYVTAVVWYAPTDADRRKAIEDDLIRELQPEFNTVGLTDRE